MIARHRGEHDSHSGRWRSSIGRQLPADWPRQLEPGPGDAPSPPVINRLQLSVWRAARRLIALAAVAGGVLAATWGLAQLRGRPLHATLPATPRAWLDAYEAAAIDNPGRVCSELFAPQLSDAYAKAVRSSCRSYFRQITSFSVVVRRVLADHETAVLELRQTTRPRDWAVVLSRQHDGWRAVDLLPGEPLR